MSYVDHISIDGVQYDIRDAKAVSFEQEQTLTDVQQEQARANIGAGSEADVADLKSQIEEISEKGIDASGASDGQVPVADGQGSWAWDDPAGGGGAVTDVQINGTSILDAQGVANVPVCDSSRLGVASVGNTYGTQASSGQIRIYKAESSNIKSGSGNFKPIVPSSQHESAFYGLAKAAGDTTQSQSSNAVGNYTDNAKSAIRTMLGVQSAEWSLIQSTVIDVDDTSDVNFVIPDGYKALKIYCIATNITGTRNIKFAINNVDRNVYLNTAQSGTIKTCCFTIGEIIAGMRELQWNPVRLDVKNTTLDNVKTALLDTDYYFGGNTLSSLTLTALSTLWNTGDTIKLYGLK